MCWSEVYLYFDYCLNSTQPHPKPVAPSLMTHYPPMRVVALVTAELVVILMASTETPHQECHSTSTK